MIPDVKVCGLRSVQDIDILNRFDVSYAGFIFAESKRRLSIDCALEMKRRLRDGVKLVCVFADMSLSDMLFITNILNPHVVQLHSDESPDIFKKFGRVVWKSVSVRDNLSILNIDKFKEADGLLLDTFSDGCRGGTGNVFDWDIVKNVSLNYFTILAGGLSADNIVEAVKTVNPHVVDVCSGVESSDAKDEIKIKKLLFQLKHCKNNY